MEEEEVAFAADKLAKEMLFLGIPKCNSLLK